MTFPVMGQTELVRLYLKLVVYSMTTVCDGRLPALIILVFMHERGLFLAQVI